MQKLTRTATKTQTRDTTADVLYVGCYVGDLFILYEHNDNDSLYSKFTAALKQRWRVEDEGPVSLGPV